MSMGESIGRASSTDQPTTRRTRTRGGIDTPSDRDNAKHTTLALRRRSNAAADARRGTTLAADKFQSPASRRASQPARRPVSSVIEYGWTEARR
uniref:Uncharacterized protein n=1 Tax=Plectus sambesii TaxID=2011161 RepID=A0A914XVT1_9BILA